MEIEDIRVFAARDYAYRRISLYISASAREDDGLLIGGFVPILKWKKIAERQEASPTLQIGEERAQELIDELWRCGFRPASLEAEIQKQIQETLARQGPAPEVGEIQRKYIEDLRRMLFGATENEGG